MRFFIFDLALVFAALLAYRTLAAVVRPRAAAVLLAGRAGAHSRAGGARNLGSTHPREAVAPRALRLQPVVPKPARRSDMPRARIHRLINFW